MSLSLASRAPTRPGHHSPAPHVGPVLRSTVGAASQTLIRDFQFSVQADPTTPASRRCRSIRCAVQYLLLCVFVCGPCPPKGGATPGVQRKRPQPRNCSRCRRRTTIKPAPSFLAPGPRSCASSLASLLLQTARACCGAPWLRRGPCAMVFGSLLATSPGAVRRPRESAWQSRPCSVAVHRASNAHPPLQQLRPSRLPRRRIDACRGLVPGYSRNRCLPSNPHRVFFCPPSSVF